MTQKSRILKIQGGVSYLAVFLEPRHYHKIHVVVI